MIRYWLVGFPVIGQCGKVPHVVRRPPSCEEVDAWRVVEATVDPAACRSACRHPQRAPPSRELSSACRSAPL